MLTKTSEYAIRSLMYIALHASVQHKVGIKEVAQELDLPLHFIGKILQDMVRKGLVASVKGPNGGFFLDRPASDISLMDVVRVIDGTEAFRRCGLGMKQCSDAHPCPLHDDFKIYRNGLARVFEERTIHDLVHEVEEGHAFLKNLAPAP